MTIPGWNRKYSEIVREFGYSKQLDYQAGVILDSVIGSVIPDKTVKSMIRNKTVFVVGAGTSLEKAVPVLRKFNNAVLIAADSSVRTLIKGGITPDVIVTDLDGDEDSLRRCNENGAILVVHAHGDNISKLYIARSFKYSIGTTQAEPYGKIRNFGGFTDGDRSVFLASHFGAGKIVLFGMDYEGIIGRLSNTRKIDVKTKLRKLEKSKDLLEWLSGRTGSKLFTTSSHIRGFTKILPKDMHSLLE